MKGFFKKVKLPFLRPVVSDSQVDSSPQIQEFLNSVIKLDVNGKLLPLIKSLLFNMSTA